MGPWFLNEMQNLFSSEKRTLDHWATVQFFFSLTQVRCFWCCLWFRSGLIAKGWRRLSVVTLDALTPASVHFLWSSSKLLNRLCLTVFSSLRSSLLLVHIFLPNFFLTIFFLLFHHILIFFRCTVSVLACIKLPGQSKISHFNGSIWVN